MGEPNHDAIWTYASAWDGIAKLAPSRKGASPQVRVIPIWRPNAVLIVEPADKKKELATALKSSFGLDLPEPGRFSAAGETEFLWSGRGKYLFVSAADISPQRLSAEIGPEFPILDQGSARALLEVSGPKVRDVLAKGLAIDLHPSAFQPGFTALCAIAYINVQIWQTDPAPIYRLSVARSYAASFWSWLVSASAEYSLSVDAASV